MDEEFRIGVGQITYWTGQNKNIIRKTNIHIEIYSDKIMDTKK
jgi:hypothetical protein